MRIYEAGDLLAARGWVEATSALRIMGAGVAKEKSDAPPEDGVVECGAVGGVIGEGEGSWRKPEARQS